MAASREKPSNSDSNNIARSRLGEVAVYFFRMGLVGFGGPLAMIALFQKELVEERAWISEADFSRALALVKALPGPVSTQMAVHLGRARAGVFGGLTAGACLIFPAFVMMILLGAFYSSVEALAWCKPLLFGMQAAALGVIADSVWRLSSPYKKQAHYWLIAAAAIAVTAWRPSSEPLVILGSGLLGLGLAMLRNRPGRADAPLAVLAPMPEAWHPRAAGTTLGLGGLAGGSMLSSLALVMLKSGAFVFGTGLAIVPLLVHDVVDVHHWLTRHQFMDALAFGQVTPGPVVITATFIGYKVAGLLGALVATAGIFGPSFFNILTWFPWAERRLGGSPYTKTFVLWAVAAVCGSIVVTLVRLTASPIEGGPIWATLLVGAGAFAAAFTRFPFWAIIPAGGIVTALLATLY